MTQTVGSLSGASSTDPRRRIALPGVLNLRDVGGYPVAGGGSVRWRTLFRSDALHLLDAAGAAAVAGLGLRTVLDLRSAAEVDIAPSPVGGRVTHLPLLADLETLPVPTVPDSPRGELELGTIYRYFVDECGDRIAAAIGELTSDDAFPALVHCTAGKDRTGWLAAVVLSALGVDREAIETDYLRTTELSQAGIAFMIGRLESKGVANGAAVRPMLEARPEYLAEAFAAVEQEYGDMSAYLRDGLGADDTVIAGLRANLLE